MLNNSKSIQRPKSERKASGIKRFDAHDYENTIQNLLEKIDELESKLILVCKDKYSVISDKNYIENENKNLKNELENENNKNIKLSSLNTEFEKAINELRLNNKHINDKANFQIQFMNNELNGHKKKINQLNNEIDSKNITIKSYSVDNKLIKNASDNYKNMLNKQININKKKDKKIINL